MSWRHQSAGVGPVRGAVGSDGTRGRNRRYVARRGDSVPAAWCGLRFPAHRRRTRARAPTADVRARHRCVGLPGVCHAAPARVASRIAAAGDSPRDGQRGPAARVEGPGATDRRRTPGRQYHRHRGVTHRQFAPGSLHQRRDRRRGAGALDRRHAAHRRRPSQHASLMAVRTASGHRQPASPRQPNPRRHPRPGIRRVLAEHRVSGAGEFVESGASHVGRRRRQPAFLRRAG